jgi:hypothetical protein
MQMPIIFYCPRCGREIRARSSAAGKKGHCVDCNQEIVIPEFRTAAPGDASSAKRLVDSGEIPNIPVGFLEDEDEA